VSVVKEELIKFYLLTLLGIGVIQRLSMN